MRGTIGNPLRDEAAAFRLVLVTIAAFLLIALGSWIDTWLGLAVALVLAGLAVHAIRNGLRKHRLPAPAASAAPDPGGARHVLVVAGGTVEGDVVLGAVRGRVDETGRVLVVVPALDRRRRTWTAAEETAVAEARGWLASTLAELWAAGVAADGHLADSDPVRAAEDALRSFSADEVVLVGPVAAGAGPGLTGRFGLPVAVLAAGGPPEPSD